MESKPVLVPNPDHPITIEPVMSRVRVQLAGKTIAESHNALVLREANYPPVYYLPAEDVHLVWLNPTSHRTYCPYKGDCSYYDITLGGARSHNAVWTYREPFDAVASIAGHLAFYPDRVDAIEVEA